MGSFQDLQQQNPQIQAQYTQFVRQQGSNGQPNWQAFRQYMQQQGQPDPGQEQPSDLNDVHRQVASSAR